MLGFTKPFRILKTCRSEIRQVREDILRLREELDSLRLQIGEHEVLARKRNSPDSMAECEMKVFSQWGQDGILQFLISRVKDIPQTFIEFGVQNYRESNTRFLLEYNNWEGLVLDGDIENIRRIQNRRGAWRYSLKSKQAFVTAENINNLIRENGFTGSIGLLVIDIDGNDYHIWEAVEVVKPVLVVIEYNSRLGPTASCTIPYDPNFVRECAHTSGIYFGASLAALESLGRKKGYSLLGCNRHGNDAFFIREEWRPESLPVKSVEEAFVRGKSQEGRDPNGMLIQRTQEEEQKLLHDLNWQTIP